MEISKPNEVPVSTWDRTSVHSLYSMQLCIMYCIPHYVLRSCVGYGD